MRTIAISLREKGCVSAGGFSPAHFQYDFGVLLGSPLIISSESFPLNFIAFVLPIQNFPFFRHVRNSLLAVVSSHTNKYIIKQINLLALSCKFLNFVNFQISKIAIVYINRFPKLMNNVGFCILRIKLSFIILYWNVFSPHLNSFFYFSTSF